jgi:methylmalonyl-CoA mutase
MAGSSFLTDFPAVPTEDWESAIRASVAGADYPAKLIWNPEEGLAVRPYYRAEDLAGLRFFDAAPGKFPYMRGSRASGEWRIREEIGGTEPERTNRCAVEAVATGSEEIEFSQPRIASHSDLALLLASLSEIPLRFCGLSHESALVLADRFRERPHGSHISADIDPLADLDFSEALLRGSPSNRRMFTVSAEDYEERGCGAIEQVAFTLSAGVEFIAAMLERTVDINCCAGSVAFSFAIGPELLLQIAKLRAFRLAWAQVAQSFKVSAQSAKPVIYARAAHWNETIYDPHVNILRATTEALSAVLGGADSVSVIPFDACFRKPDETSRRLARNVQLILKQEAHFARVGDPLGGAYAVECTTDAIATKAWKVFQELEAAGGFSKAKADGIIDSVLQRREASRKDSANCRRLVLTGTNRFADTSERADGRIDPLLRRRGHSGAAQDFEEIRLRSERAASQGKLPKVLIAEFGDAKMRNPRSQFATDFLACAGLPSITRTFVDPSEVAESDADLIVLCSSDAEYLQFADALISLLRQRGSEAQVAVAGTPQSAKELQRVGIAEFIHLRSNAVEVLALLQQKLGIGDR